jgi:hypothetical protein
MLTVSQANQSNDSDQAIVDLLEGTGVSFAAQTLELAA